MSNQKVGLVSYGISAPYYRLAVDEIIELWMNSSLDTIKVSQGVLERGVLSQDEDGNTLAVAAVKESFKRMGDTGKVQALYYGTCTNPYDSRPSSTMILEALGLPYRTKCCDLQFSMKSGTAALIHAAAMVQAGLAQQAVAIGADTVNRHTAPGDLVEPYASAAAGALVVGTQDLAATIDGMESYSSDLSDGFRVEGERYLRTGMLLGSAKNEVGLDAHTKVAVEALLQKLDAKLSDFHYVVFQQNTPGTARHCAKLLGAADSQYKPAIYAHRIGSPLCGARQSAGSGQGRRANPPVCLWLWRRGRRHSPHCHAGTGKDPRGRQERGSMAGTQGDGGLQKGYEAGVQISAPFLPAQRVPVRREQYV